MINKLYLLHLDESPYIVFIFKIDAQSQPSLHIQSFNKYLSISEKIASFEHRKILIQKRTLLFSV